MQKYMTLSTDRVDHLNGAWTTTVVCNECVYEYEDDHYNDRVPTHPWKPAKPFSAMENTWKMREEVSVLESLVVSWEIILTLCCGSVVNPWVMLGFVSRQNCRLSSICHNFYSCNRWLHRYAIAIDCTCLNQASAERNRLVYDVISVSYTR